MQKQPIRFKVILQDPNAHLFRIQCKLPHKNSSHQKFSLPSWIPGSYLIREFSKNITAMRAYSENQTLSIMKLDKDTWECEPSDYPVTVEYDVYAFDLSIRSAFLDHRGGFLNGTSLFLKPHGWENEPYEVQIESPLQNTNLWKLATAMSPLQIDQHGFGIYQAENYDELVDHPMLMGPLEEINFQVENIPHRLIVMGKHRGDLQKLVKDLQQLCKIHIKFFDSPPPFTNYTFLLRLEDDAYGGLEHRSSSALVSKRNSLPLSFETEISDNYRTLLGLFSHEYFHAWNIKKLKPKAFVPYNFNQENYTDLLWFFEGFTSYYDDLLLLRSKLITPESYLQLLSKTITKLLQTPGRFKQSVAQSSFDTWIKFYRPDENTPNAGVSYYIKGSLIALCLDFTIRQATDSKKSLDNVMRILWQQYNQSNSAGLDESDILKVAENVAGISLSSFFKSFVHKTDELPLEDLLSDFGILHELKSQETPPLKKNAVYFGAKTKQEETSNALTLAFLTEDGPAKQAGLSAGDILVAVDNMRVTSANFHTLLSQYKPEDTVKVHAFRRGELLSFDVILEKKPMDICLLSCMKNPSTKAYEYRQKWFCGD